MTTAPASSRIDLRREIARKLLHLATAAAPIAYALGWPQQSLMGVLAVLVSGAFIVEWRRRSSRRVAALFVGVTGPLLREHEHHALSGATWLFLALLLAVAILPAPAAIAAMWAVAVGDAAAALVGRTLGRRRPGGSKSLEGSIACVVATAFGALVVAQLSAGIALAAAVAAAVAEFPERPLDDNIRIVVAVGATIVLWHKLFS